MPRPREHILPPYPVWVHCVSRCVRRAYLCGGRDGRYDHRRQWIEDRLRELAGIFAVDIAAYAIMSNHIHVVCRMAPEAAAQWSDRQVVERWLEAFGKNADRLTEGGRRAAVEHLSRNPAWIAERRDRLARLDWFMRALKEPIARRANAEDACSGAFWQSRYTSVPLLDQAALIACMAYVDLNPVRAKVAPTPEASAFIAARARIRARQKTRTVRRLRETQTPARAIAAAGRAGIAPAEQAAVAADPEHGLFVAPLARCMVRWEGHDTARPLAVDDYLTLLDATGRIVRAGKRGAIDPRLAPILARLDLRVEDWVATMVGWRSMHGRALGAATTRAAEAARAGLRWIQNRCLLFARRDPVAA